MSAIYNEEIKLIDDSTIDDRLTIEELKDIRRTLIEDNNSLKKKIEELEQKLKKYTNGDNHKRYYEKNKDKIKKDGLLYLKNLKLENPEKIKEYNHNAYIKRKKKILENTQVNGPELVQESSTEPV